MLNPTTTSTPVPQSGSSEVVWPVIVILAVAGLIVLGLVFRQKILARPHDDV
jgi:LPXTG-motif cell wall-anchored protein